jgi:hypothetical protein
MRGIRARAKRMVDAISTARVRVLQRLAAAVPVAGGISPSIPYLVTPFLCGPAPRRRALRYGGPGGAHRPAFPCVAVPPGPEPHQVKGAGCSSDASSV